MKRLRRLRLLAAVCVAGAAACAPANPGERGAPAGDAAAAASPLLTSVQARAFGADSVQFTLQVTNTTDSPVELSYPSGQSFDFIVSRGGREVWRWSQGMMFTQALRSETLAAGATETHAATWTPSAGARGEYTVVGLLTARNAGASRSATFRLE